MPSRPSSRRGTSDRSSSRPSNVVLSENTVVFQPDLLFIAKDRIAIIGDRAITEAPDLVIEIHSPATHKLDHVTKRRIYAVHGVREYWIVDPELEKVDVFVLERGTLRRKPRSPRTPSAPSWSSRDSGFPARRSLPDPPHRNAIPDSAAVNAALRLVRKVPFRKRRGTGA